MRRPDLSGVIELSFAIAGQIVRMTGVSFPRSVGRWREASEGRRPPRELRGCIC
jgi:hypothetical protein